MNKRILHSFLMGCLGVFTFTSCNGALEYDRSLEPKPNSAVNKDTVNTESTKSMSADLAALANGPTFKMLTCAHRGMTYKGIQDNIPENSVMAVKYAIAAGADLLETDPRLTADGTIIVMHDASINRMTNGTGNVASLSYDNIRSHNLKVNGQVTEYKVPTLEEMLDAAKNKIYLCLDIKEPAILPKIIKIVEAKGMIDQVCYFHSATTTIDLLKKLNPKAIAFPWTGDAASVKTIAKYYPSVKMVQFGFDDDTPAAVATAKAISDAKLVGYANHLLGPDEKFLAGDHTLIDKFIANKINIVQTDYCDKLDEYLKTKGVR